MNDNGDPRSRTAYSVFPPRLRPFLEKVLFGSVIDDGIRVVGVGRSMGFFGPACLGECGLCLRCRCPEVAFVGVRAGGSNAEIPAGSNSSLASSSSGPTREAKDAAVSMGGVKPSRY